MKSRVDYAWLSEWEDTIIGGLYTEPGCEVQRRAMKGSAGRALSPPAPSTGGEVCDRERQSGDPTAHPWRSLVHFL